MNYQSGFTLFELMIAISIIAILSAVGIPNYQSYIQKAAMTEVLQTLFPYKTSVELCLLELGAITECNSNQHDIPENKQTRFIQSIIVRNGIITITTQKILQGLIILATPDFSNTSGQISWKIQCTHQNNNQKQIQLCQAMLNNN